MIVKYHQEKKITNLNKSIMSQNTKNKSLKQIDLLKVNILDILME